MPSYPADFTAGTVISSSAVEGYINDLNTRIAALQSPEVFAAHPANSSGTISASDAWTKVVFATEEFDTDTAYDTAQSRYTPKIAGYWEFGAGVVLGQALADQETAYLAVYKNGALARQIAQVTASGANGVMLAGSSGPLAADGDTDYFEVWAHQPNGSTKTYTTASYFWGRLVRTT